MQPTRAIFYYKTNNGPSHPAKLITVIKMPIRVNPQTQPLRTHKRMGYASRKDDLMAYSYCILILFVFTPAVKSFRFSFAFSGAVDKYFFFFNIFFGRFFFFLSYYIQHCFICRPSVSTVPTDPGPLQLVHWQSDALTTRLDLIRTRPDLIRTRLDLIRVDKYGRLLIASCFISTCTEVKKTFCHGVLWSCVICIA